MESVQTSPPIPTNYGTQGQYYTPGSRTIHQIPEPTVPQPTVLQTQSVRNQRPTNLLKGMFLEILQPNLIQKAPQTGRLNHFIPQWMMLTQDPWVLQTIQGHHIEFMSPPVQHSWPGMPSLPPPQEKVLDQEMKELLAKKAIHQVLTHTPSNRGFISSIFIVPKKDGGNRPVINLKPLNQFLIYEHFKMEGIHMLRDLLKQNDYLVKIDLKDAYLTVLIWKDHQKYLRFLWKGTLHEFACLPFGLATAPRVFTKLMKPVVAALRQRGIRLIIYLDDILIMAESEALTLHHAASTLNLLEGLGFIVNYNKSQLTPCQSIEFLGFLINSTNLTLQLPGEKLRKIRKTCQDILEKTEISVRELSKFLGLLTSSIFQAIFPGPLHYRHLQRLKNTTMTSEQSYEAHINTRFSSPRGSSVVARPPSRVEWQSAIPTPNRPYNRDRCLSKGLGGILRRGQHWRPMVFRGEKTTHQLSRATRRVVCNQNIHKDHSMCTCETIDGQCSSSCIYKQNGGYSFTCFSQSSNCPVGVVSRESTDSVSSTPPGKIKHTSRQGIEDFNRLERLETQSQPISSNIENMGPTRNRSLCITSDISASSLCQLEARSSSHTDRCIHNELAKNPRVRLPAIRLNWPMLTAGHVSESRTINSNISSLASTALVPTTTPTVYRSFHSAPSISRSLNERQPATSSEQPPAGWLETVCQRFETTNVSAETREILLAAWRRNTTSAYSSAWSKWVGWCGERKINPVSVSLNAILEFLKDQFKDGKAYRTINVYRSALSAVLPEIDATSVGAHPLVCQLLKGIFHLRPPEPKYSHTWSVSQVLTYIKSLGNNEGLSLKLLSLKLVTLLALTAPDRSSDLAKKDLRFRVYYPEGVSFRLPGLSKTSKPGDSPKSSFHASFGEDKDLCPVSCLKCYETNTKEFRSTDINQNNKLFLSYISPHNPVTSSTLARWIKNMLQLAGIDTGIFSAHSIRGASTSEALRQGISITEILGMADWSQESTFSKFYYRPQFNASPGRAVLSAFKSDCVALNMHC